MLCGVKTGRPSFSGALTAPGGRIEATENLRELFEIDRFDDVSVKPGVTVTQADVNQLYTAAALVQTTPAQ